MSSLASVRRTRTAMMLVGSVLVVACVAALLYAGGLALARYQGGKDRTVDATPIPSTPVGMLASVDALDNLTGITVWVMLPDGAAGGSIVSLPISSDIVGVDGSRQSLAEAYAEGGSESLVHAVESVLSLTIDQWLVATPAQLTELLQPVAPITVVFPDDVMVDDGNDEVTLFSAGRSDLSAGQMASMLNATASSQTEADRRANIEAAWAGVAAAIGNGRTEPSATPPATLGQLVSQVYAGPTHSRGLLTNELTDSSLGDRDVTELDRAEAVLVFATIAPSNMSAPAPGLVFRVEAPPNYAAKVKWTIEALLYVGANVSWVSQNGPVQATTKVLLSDQGLKDDALGAEGLFGADFEQSVNAEPIEGIDVIIQLGTSFLDDPNTGIALPSTTTTTTVP